MVRIKTEKIKLGSGIKLESYFSKNGVYVFRNNKLVGSLTTNELLKAIPKEAQKYTLKDKTIKEV